MHCTHFFPERSIHNCDHFSFNYCPKLETFFNIHVKDAVIFTMLMYVKTLQPQEALINGPLLHLIWGVANYLSKQNQENALFLDRLYFATFFHVTVVHFCGFIFQLQHSFKWTIDYFPIYFDLYYSQEK